MTTSIDTFGAKGTSHSAKFLAPLGLFGGFIDASGGGGWGPVTTSTLLSNAVAAMTDARAPWAQLAADPGRIERAYLGESAAAPG